jgi:hypothetical protein
MAENIEIAKARQKSVSFLLEKHQPFYLHETASEASFND